MADIKVNQSTGQVAVNRDGKWAIYEPGTYKVNRQNGQIALATPQGYEIHDSPETVTKLSTPDALLRMQTGGLGASQSLPGSNMSQGESALHGVQQGLTLGLSDEIGAETSAALGAMHGDVNPIDPNHPVTGGMARGFGPAYQKDIIQERDINKAAQSANPSTYKGTKFASSMLPFLASMPTTVASAMRLGGAQGGLLSFGNADTQDPLSVLKQTGLGAGGGALLGGVAQAVMRPALADTTASGLAYRALDESTPGGMLNIKTRPSSAPAELSAPLADALKSAAAMNGSAAAARIAQAQGRMANVNNAIRGEFDTPDAELLMQDIQKKASAANGPAYEAAYASPNKVGLTPNLTERPSFQDALTAAKAAAADESPPRSLDVTNLGAKDMDLIDRILQGTQKSAIESRGDTTPAGIVSKALIPTRGEVAKDVRGVADTAFPELASAREGAKESFGLQNAIETGQGWLKSTKSSDEVGAEFSKLTAPQQEAALAGFFTDIRNQLNTKTGRANIGVVFERTGLAAKLREIGFPQEKIDAITKGGQGARQVLDALQGGSDTARKLAFAKGLESSLSSVRSGDLAAGALLNSPAVALALPATRAIGNASQKKAAGLLVNALTEPGAQGIANIYNSAPQTWSGLLAQPPAYAGALLGSQIGGQQ